MSLNLLYLLLSYAYAFHEGSSAYALLFIAEYCFEPLLILFYFTVSVCGVGMISLVLKDREAIVTMSHVSIEPSQVSQYVSMSVCLLQKSIYRPLFLSIFLQLIHLPCIFPLSLLSFFHFSCTSVQFFITIYLHHVGLRSLEQWPTLRCRRMRLRWELNMSARRSWSE